MKKGLVARADRGSRTGRRERPAVDQFLNIGCTLLRNLNVHAKFRNGICMRLQPSPRFARLPGFGSHAMR
jgi:hypothetical protein